LRGKKIRGGGERRIDAESGMLRISRMTGRRGESSLSTSLTLPISKC
jgi:hypothetical protein